MILLQHDNVFKHNLLHLNENLAAMKKDRIQSQYISPIDILLKKIASETPSLSLSQSFEKTKSERISTLRDTVVSPLQGDEKIWDKF